MNNKTYGAIKGYAKALALVLACSLPSVLAINYVDSLLTAQNEYQDNRMSTVSEALKSIQSVEARSIDAATSRASIVELRVNADVTQKLGEVNRRLFVLENATK
ncbi:hypothetical protein [Streptomyces microflavus]|uniref:hypothetical protein n=1 Tax=Streptomyces microflavus TaxID=1919 RepID=UPI003639611C